MEGKGAYEQIKNESGTNVEFVPRFMGDGASTLIQWSPVVEGSQGTNFRTHALFLNDQWRVSGRLSASLGGRWDRNQGADQSDGTLEKEALAIGLPVMVKAAAGGGGRGMRLVERREDLVEAIRTARKIGRAHV